MKRILFCLIIALSALTLSAVQPQRGYRAFVDWNNFLDLDFGFLAGEPGDSKVFTGLTTGHGYQFNDWLYVGGGTGFMYNLSWKSYNHHGDLRFVIPVFAEARLDAKWYRFTPYFSLQVGANVANHVGEYICPTVGYRFNWGRKCAINFGLGATILGSRHEYHEHILQPGGGIDLGPLVHYHGTDVKFTARLGFEFQLP